MGLVYRLNVTRMVAMNSAANDNRIETVDGKIGYIARMIEQMKFDLKGADEKRGEALLKLIRMGHERIAELRALH
jgi:hypothetical protein